MGFTMDLIGLIYTYHEAERPKKKRTFLLPNGTRPFPGIQPHYASFFVENEFVDFANTKWWQTPQRQELKNINVTEFNIPEAVDLVIDTTGAEDLETSGHDNLLHKLGPISGGKFKLDLRRDGDIMARLPITSGTLEACLFVQQSGSGQGAIVSRWTVGDLHGPIKITAKDSNNDERYLTLNDGVEFVFSNTSDFFSGMSGTSSHFELYGMLDVNHIRGLQEPPTPPQPLGPLKTDNRYIREIKAGPEVPLPDCSGTCC